MPYDFDSPQPLDAAVAAMAGRGIVASPLSSASWSLLDADLRRRSFFSAKVTQASLLSEMKARLDQAIAESRDADGRTMDRARFVKEIQGIGVRLGLRPEDGDPARGGIQDVTGGARLRLIWETNMRMAQGYAKYAADMDPDILFAFPAQELYREEDREEKRDWPRAWADQGGRFFGGPQAAESGVATALQPTGMIALKTDPIWERINAFGNPYPPFDFNSGMGVRDIDRSRALELGLIERGKPVEPAKVPSFNADLWSAAPEDPGMRAALGAALGDQIEFNEDGGAHWTGIGAELVATLALATWRSIPRPARRTLEAVAARLLKAGADAARVGRAKDLAAQAIAAGSDIPPEALFEQMLDEIGAFLPQPQAAA